MNPGGSALHPLTVKCFEKAGIAPSNIIITSRGRLTTAKDNTTGLVYLVPVAKGKAVRQMRGEAASLRALRVTAPEGLIPRLYAYVESDDGSEAAMVTQYFDLAPGEADLAIQRQLGRQLAEMHRAPGAGTEGYTGKFGFTVPTHCGVTEQDNTWEEDWATFWRDRRLGDLVRRIGDQEITRAWGAVKSKAVPLLLDDFTPAPRPVIIHGDLWSGNVGYDQTTSQPVIFDPSSYWGHNEAELGMTRMFGGFTNDFYDAYYQVHPQSEPFHEQRIDLYELYHHLNHAFMFGGSYKSGALRMMRSLMEWADGMNEEV